MIFFFFGLVSVKIMIEKPISMERMSIFFQSFSWKKKAINDSAE